MKLIALLIGIYAERLLARWSHLREFRPFEEQANRLAEKALGLDARAAPFIIAGVALACAVPVGIAAWLLSDSSLEILWFVFAVAVLLVSFGPRDLKAEALDYHQKAEAGDSDGARNASRTAARRQRAGGIRRTSGRSGAGDLSEGQ